MKRRFYTSYVHDSWNGNGEKLFNNAIVLLKVPENGEKQIPLLLQEKLSAKINGLIHKTNGRFFSVTLINFWEIELI